MLKKTTLGAVLAVAGLFAVTAQVVSPQRANASDQVAVTTYSAGTLNGPICSCPVDEGNCICAWTQ
jgi:type IV secretory pathway protease TraF